MLQAHPARVCDTLAEPCQLLLCRHPAALWLACICAALWARLQVVVEEVEVQKELFYTEGEAALVEARRAIAAWSLPRAAARIVAAKQLRQGGLDVLKVGGGCTLSTHSSTRSTLNTLAQAWAAALALLMLYRADRPGWCYSILALLACGRACWRAHHRCKHSHPSWSCCQQAHSLSDC